MEAVLEAGAYVDRIAQLDAARRSARFWRYFFYAALAVLVAWSVEAIVVGDTDWSRLTAGGVARSAWSFVAFDPSLVRELAVPALETVLMATLATLGGALLAIPVAWLGAGNISPFGRFTYVVGRVLMTLSRSVHEVVWCLVFVAAVGLGALAGVLAMAVRSIGFISKTVAEAVEDVNRGPVEALRAVGANRFQVLLFAIVPQVLPVIVGNLIFEWDVNIRRSAITGLVGAGGLGLALHRQLSASNSGGVATVLCAILVLIVFGELFSAWARTRVT